MLEKPAMKEAVEDVGDPHWNEQLAPDDARRFRAFASALTGHGRRPIRRQGGLSTLCGSHGGPCGEN